jgi:hypothetical protein
MPTFYLFPRGRTPGGGDGYPVDEFQCPPFIFFLEGGHQEEVMDIQWLPSSIKFDQESAFPKELKISTRQT